MKKFKQGLAVVLSIMTALFVITITANGFTAIGGNLGFTAELTVMCLTAIIAIPFWLIVITVWHVAHKQSYLRFKKWCIYQANELSRA